MLLVLNGVEIGERRHVTASVLVGRAPGAGLRLRDADIAPRHAEVRSDPEAPHRCELVDLGSGAPVFHNGERLTPDEVVLLDEQDEIALGSVKLRFELHGDVELAFDRIVEERLTRDDLTGLFSRRRFERECDAWLEDLGEESPPLTFLLLDLDGLKAINDAHGHLAGARAIAETGSCLKEIVGRDALACRLGGDEFALLVPLGPDAGRALAEQVLAAVSARTVAVESTEIRLRASIGLASFPAHGRDRVSLLRAADEALLRVKARGGDGIESA